MTPTEALTLALYLSLSASTEEKSQEVAAMAEQIAAQHGLTELEVARCKKAALDRWEAE